MFSAPHAVFPRERTAARDAKFRYFSSRSQVPRRATVSPQDRTRLGRTDTERMTFWRSVAEHWLRLWSHDHGGFPYGLATLPLRALVASTLAGGVLLCRQIAGGTHSSPASSILTQLLMFATACLACVMVVRIVLARRVCSVVDGPINELHSTIQTFVSLLCSCLTSGGKTHDAQRQLLICLKRHLLAYAALVFEDCRSREISSELLVLLDDEESRILQSSTADHAVWDQALSRFSSSNKLRASVLELWMRQQVNHAARNDLICVQDATELNRMISTLPALYSRALRLLSEPKAWRFVRYTHAIVLGYVVLFTAFSDPIQGFQIVLWVFFVGLFLFGICALVDRIEHNAVGKRFDYDPDVLELRLLCLQDELHVILRVYFQSIGCVEMFETDSHTLHRRPITPRSPARIIPHSPSTHPPTPERWRAPEKIITRSQQELELTAIRRQTAEERQPLLFTTHRSSIQQSDSESNVTDEDDDDELHRGYMAV